MPSILKRGSSYRVTVSYRGVRESATFPTKGEAKAWGLAREAEARLTRINGIVPNKTLADLLDRYETDVSPDKRGHDWERKRIAVLKGYRIASVRLSDLDATHVAQWKKERLQDVSSASVARDWNLLSHACTVAMREWKWMRNNPFREVARPKDSPPRQRVFTGEEIEGICLALGLDVHGIALFREFSISQRVALAFLFALETGMRAGEIVSLTRDQVHDRHVSLTLTKNGDSRDVPLSSKAREIIGCMTCHPSAKNPRDYGKVTNPICQTKVDLSSDLSSVFGLNSRQLDSLFRKAKKRAGVSDATFHDSRRTALTKLAKVFTNPLELARVSGHRDVNMLIKVYYAPSVEDLAERMK